MEGHFAIRTCDLPSRTSAVDMMDYEEDDEMMYDTNYFQRDESLGGADCLNDAPSNSAIHLDLSRGVHPHAPSLAMNKSFAYRLANLRRQGAALQYELAVLTTLGGAYHLCNHPREALMLSHRLEILGNKLGWL